MLCLQPDCTDLSCQTPSENAQSYFGRRQFLRDLIGGGVAVGSLSSISGCSSWNWMESTVFCLSFVGISAWMSPL